MQKNLRNRLFFWVEIQANIRKHHAVVKQDREEVFVRDAELNRRQNTDLYPVGIHLIEVLIELIVIHGVIVDEWLKVNEAAMEQQRAFSSQVLALDLRELALSTPNRRRHKFHLLGVRACLVEG